MRIKEKTSKFIKIAHSDEVTALCLNPKQDILVSGSKDLIIKVWDMENMLKKFQLHGHSFAIKFLTFKHENVFISASCKQFKVWSLD